MNYGDYVNLIEAGRNGNVDVVKECLSSGAINVNSQDWNRQRILPDCDDDFTPLMAIVSTKGSSNQSYTQKNCDQIVRLFYKAGAGFYIFSNLQDVLAKAIKFFSFSRLYTLAILTVYPNSPQQNWVLYNPSAYHGTLRKMYINALEKSDCINSAHDNNNELVDSFGKTAFHYACETRRIDIVQLLIKLGRAAINNCDIYGNTPLLSSYATESEELARLLIKSGASVNVMNKKGISALHLAVVLHSPASVVELIDAGADVHAVGSRGTTPLHSTALCNSQTEAKDKADILIKAGSDINAIDSNGDTALIMSCREGRFPVFKALLQAGADSSIKNRFGEDVFDIVSDPLFTQALLDHHVENKTTLTPNASNINTCILDTTCKNEGKTALIMACQDDHVSLISEFIEADANVNATDFKGNTPLHYAVLNMNLDSTTILIKAGADVNSVNARGESPLSLATLRRFTDIIRILIDAGADVNHISRDGRCPLFNIFRGDTTDVPLSPVMITSLIEAGALLETCNDQYVTPLVMAVCSNMVEAAQILVDAGARIDYILSSSSLVLMVSTCGMIDMTRVLIKAGGDITTVDCEGFTCLHIVCSEGIPGDISSLVDFIQEILV